jgi:hypothetical protein
MPKSHRISTEELGKALKETNGSYKEVAKHFGVREDYIRKRVSNDPKLRPIWIKNGTKELLPDKIEVMNREPAEEKNKRFIEALQDNGRAAFESDLESMLSKPNYEKLKVFDNFDDSVGMLMAEALRVTQKVNIRQNMSLFEVTESLKEDLEDQTMDPEERVLKTRLFLLATEQQGKFYDRLLRGLDFQLKLHNEKEKKETKNKPGFRPLKELKDVEEDQS